MGHGVKGVLAGAVVNNKQCSKVYIFQFSNLHDSEANDLQNLMVSARPMIQLW